MMYIYESALVGYFYIMIKYTVITKNDLEKSFGIKYMKNFTFI